MNDVQRDYAGSKMALLGPPRPSQAALTFQPVSIPARNANAFSTAAKVAIEKVGGTATII